MGKAADSKFTVADHLLKTCTKDKLLEMQKALKVQVNHGKHAMPGNESWYDGCESNLKYVEKAIQKDAAQAAKAAKIEAQKAAFARQCKLGMLIPVLRRRSPS